MVLKTSVGAYPRTAVNEVRPPAPRRGQRRIFVYPALAEGAQTRINQIAHTQARAGTFNIFACITCALFGTWHITRRIRRACCTRAVLGVAQVAYLVLTLALVLARVLVVVQ